MPVQREWLDKDYYEVLGVAPDADNKDIKRAYRRLARQYHPDANPGDPHAEERFKAISAAYDVLGDPAERAEYDQLRRAAGGRVGAGGFGAGGFETRGFRGFDPRGFDTSGFDGSGFQTAGFDLGDLFGDLLARTRGSGPPAAATGRDLQADLHLHFEDAVFGHTTELSLSSRAECATCNGTGAKPGTTPVTCANCHGRGQISTAQGRFAITGTCPRCSGRGQIAAQPCSDCGGAGTRPATQRVNVRIPAGVTDGQVLRLRGRGEPGSNGGRPGDLYVQVHVSPHPLFGRAGANLTLTVPVTYPEAALGVDLKVPTLGGAPVTVRIPAGTPSGRVLRVPGHGVPRPDGTRGDLLLTVEVSVPTHMTGKERKAVENLAKAMNGHSNPRQHLGV